MTNTAQRFRILGTTQDVTNCECCGRVGLKKTVVLGVLDADGVVMCETHYGVDCAARATGFGAAAIKARAEGKTAGRVSWNGWTLWRGTHLLSSETFGIPVRPDYSEQSQRAFDALSAMLRGELIAA